MPNICLDLDLSLIIAENTVLNIYLDLNIGSVLTGNLLFSPVKYVYTFTKLYKFHSWLDCLFHWRNHEKIETLQRINTNNTKDRKRNQTSTLN